MKALILFGSESDKPIYNALIDDFSDRFETDFEVISAHRNPARLKERLSRDDYHMVIAGAGLAAHLPGVVASLTDKPVFGIPVAGNFAGIDAFLSIVQMPKGVPVLACHPDNHWQIIKFVSQIMGAPKDKIFVVSDGREDHQKLIDVAQEKVTGIDLAFSEKPVSGICNLILVDREEDLQECETAIYLPVYGGKDKNEVHKAFEFFNYSKKKGLWVGANNVQNGFLFYKRLWEAMV